MSARRRSARRPGPPESPRPAPWWSSPRAISLGLVVLTIAAFHPVWRFDFVSLDDPEYVRDNAAIAGGVSAGGLRWALTAAYSGNWHPLTWTSHMLDVQLFGMQAGGHHAVNLALHIAATLLLFAWLRRHTAAIAPSALAAALFAVHPLHVESVAWISERKDVLSGLFFMLTLWAYAAYVRQPRVGRYALVAACFALGLMSKPMLVTMPFVLLLVDWWPLERRGPWTRLVLEKLPLMAIAAVSSALTYVVQRSFGATFGQDVYSFGTRAANALHSYAMYLADLFWPVSLSVFYPFRYPIPAVQIAIAAALFAAISAIAVRFARRAPFLFTGWFWFAGMLVPVIGVVQAGGQARADRYTYLPLIGLFIAIAWGLSALIRERPALARVVTAGAIAAVIGCAIVTHAQVQSWRDGEALWRHALEVDPDNFRAHAAYGVLVDRERHDTALAIAHLTDAVRLQPGYAEPRQNLARILVREGRFQEAIPHFAEVVRLQPDSPDALSDLGRALTESGRYDEAVARLVQALRLNPSSAGIHNNLGSAYAAAGRLPESLVEFTDAVTLEPGFEQAHFNLALALAKLGRFDEAAREFAEVLRINPSNNQARFAAESLARRGK